MLNIFGRSLRVGARTTHYPEQPEPSPAAYRGQVVLNTGRCTGDGACAEACPSQAITVDYAEDGGWVWQLDDARCVFCGLCADACPADALELSNEFELAVRSRGDLVSRATFVSSAAGVEARGRQDTGSDQEGGSQ